MLDKNLTPVEKNEKPQKNERVSEEGLKYSIVTRKSDERKYVSIIGIESDVEVLNIPHRLDNEYVEVIKKGAFEGNDKLKQVIIPEGIRLIGAEAFKNCINLKQVELPHNLEVINQGCFEGCQKLNTINVPQSLKKVCSAAFKDSGISKKLFDNGDVSIAKNAFLKQVKKTTINIDEIEGEEYVEDGIIYNIIFNKSNKPKYAAVAGLKDEISELNFPEKVRGVNVEVIKKNAFAGNSHLEKVYVSDNIRVLGANAFKDCVNLKWIELPAELTVINESVFEGCTNVKTIVLPYELKRIAKNAFKNCHALSEMYHYTKTGIGITMTLDKSLKESKLPSGLEYIGAGAFSGCHSLADVYLPWNITEILEDSFKDCINLKSVRLHKKVDRILSGAFAGCDSIENVKIPNSLKKLAADAFGENIEILCSATLYKKLAVLKKYTNVRVVRPEVLNTIDSRMIPGVTEERFYSDEELTNAVEYYELRTPMDEVKADPDSRMNIEEISRYKLEGDKYVYSNGDNTAKIMMTGDLMCRFRQMGSAYRTVDGYNFDGWYEHISPILKQGDLVIGNMESMASNSYIYSDKASFIDDRVHLNAPDSFVSSVKNAGFDLVVNAQNHAYDTGTQGVFETLHALNRAQLMHTGLFAGRKEKRYVSVEVNGFKVAVLSYFDQARQPMKRVNFTNEGLKTVFSTFREHQIQEDVAAARADGAEFIIAYSHCGREYTDVVSERQENFAIMLAEAGVDYIFGCHSHCLQPYREITTSDNRVVPVLYSGGNFYSDMSIKMPYVRDTLITELVLGRDASGKVCIEKNAYHPCLIKYNRDVRGNILTVPVRTLLDADNEEDRKEAVLDLNRIMETIGRNENYECLVDDKYVKAIETIEKEPKIKFVDNYNVSVSGEMKLGPMNAPNDPHPKTIIATCILLGTPLPDDAVCGYQPSAYIEPGILSGELEDIKEYFGDKLPKIEDDELVKRFRYFRTKFKSQKNLVYNETDLTVYFCDWLFFARDRGFSYTDYFDYELYRKESDIRDTFLNEGYRTRVHNACSRVRYRGMFRNKAGFNKRFAKFVKRDWIDASVCTFDEFKEFADKHPKFFGKPVTGTGGMGARVIHRDDYEMNELYKLCKDEELICEELVQQHESLAKVNASTLNTVRVTTLLGADNVARITLTVARFGREGNAVDNFHGGGVGAIVNVDTGVIETEAINRAHIRHIYHPDSKVKLLGFQYPEWEKVKAAVCEAAEQVPQMRNIGWDVSVTKDGEVEFIEGNGRPNFDVLQSPDQIGRRFRYEEILADLEKMKGIETVILPPLEIEFEDVEANVKKRKAFIEMKKGN